MTSQVKPYSSTMAVGDLILMPIALTIILVLLMASTFGKRGWGWCMTNPIVTFHLARWISPLR